MASEPLVNRAPDDFARKAERTIGKADALWRAPPNPSADVAQVTPPSIEHKDAPTTGSLIDRPPDDIERKAERTIGMAHRFWRLPPNPSTDVAQVAPPSIEHEDAPATGSPVNRPPAGMEHETLLTIGTATEFWRQPLLAVLLGVMVVLALALIELLLRRPVGWEIKFIDLKSKTPAELVSFAEDNGVENASTMPKQELLFAILEQIRAPNQVAADPSAVSNEVAADSSAASGLILAIVFSLFAIASMAGWLYVLGEGTFKLVSWLLS